MLTLKSICFLRVSSLNLSYEDLPGDLPVELKKMEKFNGHFFLDEPSNDKKAVLSIQYQGNGDWSFQVCSQYEKCTSSCQFGECQKKPELFQQLVLKEKKTSASVFGNLKGLLTFGMSGCWAERMLRSRSSVGDIDQRAVSITLEVEDTETYSGILSVHFKHPGVESVKCLQLLVDLSSGSVQVVRFFNGKPLLLSLLTECEG